MGHGFKKTLGGLGICLGVCAACILILLLSAYLGTGDSSVSPYIGGFAVISMDVCLMITMLTEFAPSCVSAGGSKKDFGSYVSSGYLLAMLSTVFMYINGWYISGHKTPSSSGSKFIDLLRDLFQGVGEGIIFFAICADHFLLLIIAVLVTKARTKE